MLSKYNSSSHGAFSFRKRKRRERRYNILIAVATCDVNLLRECKF